MSRKLYSTEHIVVIKTVYSLWAWFFGTKFQMYSKRCYKFHSATRLMEWLSHLPLCVFTTLAIGMAIFFKLSFCKINSESLLPGVCGQYTATAVSSSTPFHSVSVYPAPSCSALCKYSRPPSRERKQLRRLSSERQPDRGWKSIWCISVAY